MTRARSPRPGQAGALAIVVTLALTGCGDADEGSGTDDPSTTTRPGDPAAPTTTAAVDGDTEPCAKGSATVPDGSVAVETAAIDADGDGLLDAVTTFGRGDDADPAPWSVVIEFGAGGAATLDLAFEDRSATVEPLGGHDLDGDGDVEPFLRVGAGASSAVVTVLQAQGCAIAPVTLDGSPLMLPVGASASRLDSLGCLGDGLRVLSATTSDGLTYTWTERRLRLEGSELSEVDRDAGEGTSPPEARTCPGVAI